MTTRREFFQTSALGATALAGERLLAESDAVRSVPPKLRPLLTAADDFYDVSRGNPKPYTLTGEALKQARLTEDTWRLEIVADGTIGGTVKEPAGAERELRIDDGTALDFPALLRLAEKHRVRYLKAMQCLNIAEPLGQGLWEGVPLRDVLRLCGSLKNVRRIYYDGFHNNDPKQIFQSSLTYSQAMETAPGDPPVFLAYRLNGEPISLERGGPVRLVVPWAHGFKSIKWLRRISLTNDFRANDTYANANNDPEAPLKTAAYVDPLPRKFAASAEIYMSGQVISGLSGVARVEYWLRRVPPGGGAVVYDDAQWRAARWLPCDLEPEPENWDAIMPAGVSARGVLGFDAKTGRARTWPLRYGMASWTAVLRNLGPGEYEFRVRGVDLNGYAQPEPRPLLKAGKNAVETHAFAVV